jgi:hypothetical protein
MNYKPYFYINEIGIFSKAYFEHKKEMLFFDQHGRLQASIYSKSNIYDWNKCKKLFGDK